jgi:hypothetical protein
LATSGADNFTRNQSTEGSSQFTAFQWHSNHASAAFNWIYLRENSNLKKADSIFKFNLIRNYQFVWRSEMCGSCRPFRPWHRRTVWWNRFQCL